MNKKDYKILLVSFYNEEAYGVRQLHTILNHNGYDTKMLFLKLNSKKIQEEYKEKIAISFSNEFNEMTLMEEEILANFILKYKPNIIGFSLVSSNFGLYKRIYEKIRNIGDFKIILGGWQVSLNPEQCIDYADILCIGEGDDVLLETVNKLYSKQSIENIQNLWINTKNGIIKNAVRPLNIDLNQYPIPIFNDENSYYIENNMIIHKEPYLDNNRYGIMTARGCPYHCTYCSNNYMATNIYPKAWSKIRHRSIEHVMDELNYVKKTLPIVDRINFYDEVFLPSDSWMQIFIQRYPKEIGMPFYCMFYPGICKEERVKLLKNAMLNGVWLGIQSGSYRVRKEIFKRNYTNQCILEQAKIFNKYNISVRYDFILDNPFETFDESLEGIKLLLELPEPFTVNLFSLKYFPNTEITTMALKKGVICDVDFDNNIKTDHHNYFISTINNNNFINHIFTYTSLLASEGRLLKEKNNILKLINNYKENQDLNEIKSILKINIDLIQTH